MMPEPGKHEKATELRHVYSQGYNQRPYTNNPYAPGSVYAEVWEQGFKDGLRTMQRSKS